MGEGAWELCDFPLKDYYHILIMKTSIYQRDKHTNHSNTKVMNDPAPFPRCPPELLCWQMEKYLWRITDLSRLCLLFNSAPRHPPFIGDFTPISSSVSPSKCHSLVQAIDQEIIVALKDLCPCYCCNWGRHWYNAYDCIKNFAWTWVISPRIVWLASGRHPWLQRIC